MTLEWYLEEKARLDAFMKDIDEACIAGVKDIVKSQSKTMQMINKNMKLLRAEVSNLQKKIYDINSRLVELEDWKFEKFKGEC